MQHNFVVPFLHVYRLFDRKETVGLVASRKEIRFCRSKDGVRIAYTVSGNGPPLIRVANWLTHLDLDRENPIWSRWFGEFSNGYQFVVYDPRGTGLSDRGVDAFSLDGWVHDLEAVVEDCGFDRVNLLGFCQGGPVATAYAARHPERVDHLVLYDSFACGAFAGDAPPRQRREAEALTQLIEVGWGQKSSAFRQVFTHLLLPHASADQQHWLTEMERRSVTSRTASLLWQAFHEIDIRSLTGLVKSPTLILHVQGDAMVPFESGLKLASLIRGARFVPLEGENHILLEDEPAWAHFVAEVRGFLGTGKSEFGNAMPDAQTAFQRLTARECEVLDLLAFGFSNAQIAEHLCLTSKTVRNHVTHIYTKLGVENRAQAVIFAREAGLGQSQSGPTAENKSFRLSSRV